MEDKERFPAPVVCKLHGEHFALFDGDRLTTKVIGGIIAGPGVGQALYRITVIDRHGEIKADTTAPKPPQPRLEGGETMTFFSGL